MPIYSYHCELCDAESDLQVKYEQRLDPQPCARPGCPGMATYKPSAPLVGTGRIRGDRRLITDERQVIADRGADWRDQGTTGREGGAGAKGRIFLDLKRS